MQREGASAAIGELLPREKLTVNLRSVESLQAAGYRSRTESLVEAASSRGGKTWQQRGRGDEHPEEGGSHTATAAHVCTLDAQGLKTEVSWMKEDKGTS